MKQNSFSTEQASFNGISLAIDTMMQKSQDERKSFERRWYDNNFFDDGYHFRYLSRSTGKIIDTSDKDSLNLPTRAIPKTSLQIRGIANLLISQDPKAVIYPEKIGKGYTNPQEYQAALQESKDIAKKSGVWLMKELENQNAKDLLTQMIILSEKHSISFLQVWPDAIEEAIRMQVYDAFDIYLVGHLTSIYDSPYIVKAAPQLISKIKANENFNEEQVKKITPDNKYASSEIKEAYMKSRFGSSKASESSQTLIQKEAFIKEYLNDDNWENVVKLGENNGVMEGKKKGDMVIRHTFSAGGLTLMDEYVNLPEYPFVDFRMEPGPIYQVPLIERFIPANKTLDIISSRIERFSNSMIVGTWLKRKGEDFIVSNTPGGNLIEYSQTPPQQMPMANIPPFLFNFLSFIEKIIEEQGASTSALGQLPTGVKSGVAIESLKATEYAKLKISSDQLKLTMKRIAERMLDIADKHFIKPQTVMLLENGNPNYFDIIGQESINARKKLGIDIPQGTVPIKKDYHVSIEIESGLGYTMEGKKQSMQQIIDYVAKLASEGLITQDAVKVVVTKFLEIFQFGATQEFMDAMDQGTQASPLNEEQITQMKVVILEVMKEAGMVGQEKDQKLVDSTKVGVMEAMKESGILEKLMANKSEPQQPTKQPSESISYKDLPPEGQAQMAAKVGIQITPQSAAINKPVINTKIKNGTA
ncbi:MAG: hypothetical protein AAB922_04910 [Patescibacteria group bacterium]